MKFLNNLDLLQNQLQNAVVHLVTDIATMPGEKGQLAYESAKDILYIYTDDGWTIVPTIKTLAADPSTGNVVGEIYFDTENGILKVFDGAAWKSVGKLVTNGTKGAQTGTSGLTFGGDGSTVTIAHASVTTTPATSTDAPNYEDSFTVIDSLTIDNGHVTGYNTKTVTLPDDTLYDISVVDPTVGDAAIQLHDTLNGTDSVVFVGENITITPTDENTITITHPELDRVDTDDTSIVDYADTIDVVDSVTTDLMGHVSAINVKTITLPSEVSYTFEAVAGTADESATIRFQNDLREADVTEIYLSTGATSGLDINYVNANEINIAHSDTSDQTTVTGLTGLEVISEIALDDFGHITAIDTRELSLSGLGIDLQTVTDEGATTDNAISITNITEAAQIGEGALIVSGGASFAKNVFIGGNLTVEGEITAIQSNEVNIGDSNILLNADITLASENSNGGVSVKRLASDDVTRRDVAVEFDTTSNRWQQTYGPTSAAVRTSVLPVKLAFTLDAENEEGVAVDVPGVVYTITHNLNTKDLVVTLREVAADYEAVYANIEFATLNTLVVRFASAPDAGAYRITIIG